MKTNTITFLIICVFLVSCSQAPTAELTPEDQAFLDAVNAMDTTFTVPEEESDATWGRIKSFISEFSSMQIQTSSDIRIRTDRPSGYSYGYSADRKTLSNGEVEFTVSCTCDNQFGAKNAALNAKCLAYFAKTGEINPTLINK